MPQQQTTETADTPANVIAEGGNLTALKGDVKAAVLVIVARKAERDEISADIRATKKALAAKGITTRALNRAIQDYETESGDNGALKRRADDEAYWIAREAMGLPSQTDFFEAGPGKGNGAGAEA